MKKIFSNKKVMGTLAAVMAVALLLGGTFAWRDISQNAQNVFKASSYEAELVDIFTPPSNWEKDESINKDVYVKNTGSGDIFVRVNFDDILKLAGASEQAQNPYTAFTVNGDGTADTTSFSKFEWAMGNGLIYDIADWNGCTDAWYLDATTGWFYWGNVLTSATQTDKLLDAVKLLTDVDKDFEYIINVNMHAFSADQKGIEDLEDTDGGSANVPDEVKDMVNGIVSGKNSITLDDGTKIKTTGTEKVYEILDSNGKSKNPKEYIYDKNDSIKKNGKKDGSEIDVVVGNDGNFYISGRPGDINSDSDMWINLSAGDTALVVKGKTPADGIDNTLNYVPDLSTPMLNNQDTTFYIDTVPSNLKAGDTYQLKIYFADPAKQLAYDNGTLKLKFYSNDKSAIEVDEKGILSVLVDYSNTGASIGITVIAPDGSIKMETVTIHKESNINSSTYIPVSGMNSVQNIYVNSPTIKLMPQFANASGNVNSLTKTLVTGLNYIVISDGVSGDYSLNGNLFTPGNTDGVVKIEVNAKNYKGNDITPPAVITVNIDTTPANALKNTSFSGDWSALEAAAEYESGIGTASNPYEIACIEQLKKLNMDVKNLGAVDATYGKYFILSADLDFHGATVEEDLIDGFYGIFDGQGKEIRNLVINRPNVNNPGGIISFLRVGEVKNLGRVGGSTTGFSYVTGFINSVASGAKVTNCYSTADVIAQKYAGGMFTSMKDGIIKDCYFAGKVSSIASTGVSSAGGLCSYINNDVSGTKAQIENFENRGIISGGHNVGGIIGYIHQENVGVIELSGVKNLGTITRNSGVSEAVGAIIGNILNSTNSTTTVNLNNVASKSNMISYTGVGVQPDKGVGMIDTQAVVNGTVLFNLP